MSALDQEIELLSKIRTSTCPVDRAVYIAELEKVPVSRYGRDFYDRWIFINRGLSVLECWGDNVYDPSKSFFPRDVQILCAALFGKLDIDNGGFHQFFGNSTGEMSPEMIEWFERSGLTNVAIILREAMSVFGTVFPRSQDERRRFLAGFPGFPDEDRMVWDPFTDLDRRFYEAFSDDDLFDRLANNWIRNVCGITTLAVSFT